MKCLGYTKLAAMIAIKSPLDKQEGKFNTRFKEHQAHLKFGRKEKSAIAAHSIETGHIFNSDNLKLLKNIVKPKYLNAWETYFIESCNKNYLLNNEDGPILNSKLINLIASRTS